MDFSALAASLPVLIATVVGAAVGALGSIIPAIMSGRAERRRMAVESGFREWERLTQSVLEQNRGGDIFPPVLFVYFNYELIKLIDSDSLTPASYRTLARKRDAVRAVIVEDSEARKRGAAL